MVDYKIFVNDKRLQKELNNTKDKIKEIIYFFNVNNINVNIKILNYNEFKSEFHSYLGYEINANITGFIEDDKNTIIILSYNDFKFTNHYGESYGEYVKIVIHEFVHIIHSIACKRNYPSEDLWEGIAVYLSEQYNFENENGFGLYYDYGKRIYDYLKMNSKEDLLKKLLCN